jgi:hypothetical protein
MFHDFIEFFRMIYGFFAHATGLTYAAIGVGLFMAVLYFRIIFEDFSGFREALADCGGGLYRSRMSPQIVIWIMISVGCGALSYYQLPGWFPHLFGK